jgi:hypothetical protein
MAHEPHEFDLDKLRRNWSRAEDPPGLSPAAKTGRIRAPVDVPGEAAELVRRVKELGLTAHPDRTAALVPFLDRAERAALRLAAEAPEARAEARAELLSVIADLEDLFDVFSWPRR